MGILFLMFILYCSLVAGYMVTYRIQDARATDSYKGKKRKSLDTDFNRCIFVSVATLLGMIAMVVFK